MSKSRLPRCDNGRGAIGAKMQLRRNALEAVEHPSVFDAFCGDGHMWQAVWSEAESYLGCDEKQLSLAEKHRRLVCDNKLALRSLDLSQFNIFDFDAYGSPWEQMVILAARRIWAPSERGAVVLTDGTSRKLRYGGAPHAMAQLAGVGASGAPTDATTETWQSFALAGWLKAANVKPLRQWRAEGKGSGLGGQRMVYTALVFEGQATLS